MMNVLCYVAEVLAIALVVSLIFWLLWRRGCLRRTGNQMTETVEELTAQKFSLAEANLNMLESKELLQEQKRQLEEQKMLLESSREMLELQKQKLAETNLKLFQLNEELEVEKGRSEKLLLNILPPQVAEELKATGRTEPEYFDSVTVLFSDLVNFTTKAAAMSPAELIGELNDIFTNFDNIAEANGCERIKTIGDAYLAISGITAGTAGHTGNMLRAAVAMLDYLHRRNARGGHQWQIRIGIQCGSLVGGVVGVKKYIYDIFGDTVNTAARLEHHCEPMRINVSAEVVAAVGSDFSFEARPAVEVKGKGLMPMFFLTD